MCELEPLLEDHEQALNQFVTPAGAVGRARLEFLLPSTMDSLMKTLALSKDRVRAHLLRMNSLLQIRSWAGEVRAGQAAWLATPQACSAWVSRENSRLGAS